MDSRVVRAVRWIEAIALLPATILVLPSLLLLLLFGVGLFMGMVFGSHPLVVRSMLPVLLAPFFFFSGSVGLVGAWLSVLVGTEAVIKRPKLRRMVQLSLVLGIGASGCWFWFLEKIRPAAGSFWIYWSQQRRWLLLLVPAIAVVAWEFYLLVSHPGRRPQLRPPS